jgi:hypothetical protein
MLRAKTSREGLSKNRRLVMEKNKITFDYDRASNILFVEDQWDIKTREDVDAFFAEYERNMKNVKEKFWMVAHIDKLAVHADVAEYYGEVARKATNELVLGLARWGVDSTARMALRTTAMKAKMPYTIHTSREKAVQAVEQMKAERNSKRQ